MTREIVDEQIRYYRERAHEYAVQLPAFVHPYLVRERSRQRVVRQAFPSRTDPRTPCSPRVPPDAWHIGSD